MQSSLGDSVVVRLRHISYQNHLAALIVQKLYRGHRVRLRLWQFNGVLTISRALKIQRVWRGFQGRKRAAAVYAKLVLRSAHIIHTLFYTWRHKRKRLVAHLKFMKNSVIKFQSQFRRRKATELVRVVRYLHHTKTAVKMQSAIRMFLAKCLVRRRRLRLKAVCSHLMMFCRKHIFDSDSDGDQHTNTSSSGSSAVMGEHEPIEPSVSSLDKFLCTLVGVGKYEAALEMVQAMSKSDAISNSAAASFNYDVCSFVVYASLMALWTRKGKIRAVREDYLEEALSIVLQYHLLRPTTEDKKVYCPLPNNNNSNSNSNGYVDSDGNELSWFNLSGNKYLVRDKTLSIPPEGFKHSRVGGTYDDVIVLIRQSIADRSLNKLSKSQLLERYSDHSNRSINLSDQYNDEWDAMIQTYYHCAQPHYHGTSISSYDAMLLFSDCIGYHGNNKHLMFSNVSNEVLVDPYLHAGGPHKRKHKQHKLHVMVNRKAEQLRLSQKTDHQFNSQRNLTNFTVIERISLLCEDVAYQYNTRIPLVVPTEDMRSKFLTLSRRKSKQRMVFLLRKAQDLLSQGSPALEEISLRLEVFNNLYKDEDECDVLACLSDKSFAFPNQSDLAKNRPPHVYEGQVVTTAAVPTPPVSATKVDPATANAAAVAVEPPKLTWQQKQKIAKDEFFKKQNELVASCVHIIHTGSMVMIKGFTTLDKLITQFLPPPDYVEPKPKLPKSRAAAALEALEAKPVDEVMADIMRRASLIRIVIRPLLLFHTEIEQLAREYELYEEQVSAVDMEVSNVAAADAVYVHVKVIDYIKIAKFLLENVQLEMTSSHLVPQEIRSILSELLNHRQLSRETDNNFTVLMNHSLKFKLLELENRRTERNNGRLADFVTRILQKLFRGFRGRIRFNKLKQRKLAKEAKMRILAEKHLQIKRYEEYRAKMAKEIQRVMRGKVWRAKLRVMKRCALMIQCAFRVFRAKTIVDQERLRRSAGPQVVPMYRNGTGVVVGKAKFTLQVYRCGNNYKFEGVDLLEGCIYHGHCHQHEVMEVLRDFNATITGTTVADDLARINLWQHQRVCDKLVENLGFATMMTNVTTEMGVGKVDTRLCLVVNKQSKAEIPSIQKTKEKSVGHYYKDYNKLLKNHPQLLLNSKSVKQIKKTKV